MRDVQFHPALLQNSYDIAMFDELGNKTFGEYENATYKVGPTVKERDYIQPTGWTRYGLKVLGKYSDDKWLKLFQDPGNWYRACMLCVISYIHIYHNYNLIYIQFMEQQENQDQKY